LENNNVGKIYHQGNLPHSFQQPHNSKIHNTIVLSPVSLKSDLIFSNRVLAAYFTVFKYALADSNTLCLIGYGGGDIHINEEIKKWVYDKVVKNVHNNHIYIINYAGEADFTQEEWAKKLYPVFKYEKRSIDNYVELHYKTMDNILDFDFQIQN
jgi:hypothetical protein